MQMVQIPIRGFISVPHKTQFRSFSSARCPIPFSTDPQNRGILPFAIPVHSTAIQEDKVLWARPRACEYPGMLDTETVRLERLRMFRSWARG